MRNLRLVVMLLLTVLATSVVRADSHERQRRRPCRQQTTRAGLSAALPVKASEKQGDVCIPIILAAYSDLPFTIANIQSVWSDMANKKGYAEHGAIGSLADYFDAQSRGQFRVTFDVLGPVTLSESRSYYGANDDSGNDVRTRQMIIDACKKAAELDGVDFKRYDWDGDGTVETVLVVYAGEGENTTGAPKEAVWPKMGGVSATIGGCWLNNYACANELTYPDKQLEGYGTLCHEFSHCLGLPDLYNVDIDVNDYIVFDEWDVMDGGCYATDGWTPVGYSAYERWLCGWLEPEELKTQTTVSDMQALTDGGKAYLIRNDAQTTEFYLLENRQQRDFDYYLPGHGLLVTHITNYAPYNMGPNNGSTLTIFPIPADDLTYKWSYWHYVRDFYGVELPTNANLNVTTAYKGQLHDEYGRNRLMAGTAYPYTRNGKILNDRLTDTSQPAATLRYANKSGQKLMSKPLTDIREENGLVSFCFMDPSAGIATLEADVTTEAVFDLNGRRLTDFVLPSPSLYLVRQSDGTIKKVMR